VEKDAKKTKKAKGTMKTNKPVQTEDEPRPLAMIPPPGFAPAPHLPQEALQGIGQGFLQIQPKSVSAALLKQDDIDD
jgi:hypothetical protein